MNYIDRFYPARNHFIRLCRQILLLVGVVVLSMSTQAMAQSSDDAKNCSEHTEQLLKKAWAAQPMNTRANNRNPAKAESLYKEAIKDSPRCAPANNLLVGLLIRNLKYEEAREYNDRFLRSVPDQPQALNARADLLSILTKDYSQALTIRLNLLKVPGFNNSGSVFYAIAETYSLMNKLDESLEYLKMALSLNKGWGDKWNAPVNPAFENLRNDSRFWSLVNQK